MLSRYSRAQNVPLKYSSHRYTTSGLIHWYTAYSGSFDAVYGKFWLVRVRENETTFFFYLYLTALQWRVNSEVFSPENCCLLDINCKPADGGVGKSSVVVWTAVCEILIPTCQQQHVQTHLSFGHSYSFFVPSLVSFLFSTVSVQKRIIGEKKMPSLMLGLNFSRSS